MCQTDWKEDITTKKEIFRDAELLHADNEQLADEVLGRTHGEEDDVDNELTPDLIGVPQTPNGSVDLDLIREEIGVGHSERPEALDTSGDKSSAMDHGDSGENNVSNHYKQRQRRKSAIMLQIG